VSIFKQFQTDKSKELEGIDVEFGANEDGSVPTFKLARMCRSNKKYTKAIEAATKPVQRLIELGTLKDSQGESIMLDVFVSTILLGWENIVGPDGHKIPFSKENAKSLMIQLPDLYDELQDKAKKISLFMEASLEQDAKN
jgi:hypothetical protein